MAWILAPRPVSGTPGSSGDFVSESHTGNVSITGSLTVNELISTTAITTGDNLVILNDDVVGLPTENAGLEITRGSETAAQLVWNETLDRWQAGVLTNMQTLALSNEVATTAQGSLADTALQPFDDISELTNNVGYLTESSHDGLPQDNPHGVTAAQVGLGNVDNTSDADKPVSTAQQAALDLKYDASNPSGFETPAELDARDTANRDRANHTGTQTASTISDFVAAVQSAETTTSLSLNANILKFTDEDGVETDLDLSLYLDDTNLSRIVSGTLDGGTGIATFTRDDTSTFTVDFSALNDQGAISTAITNHEAAADPHPQYTTTAEATAAAPIQSVNGETGVLTNYAKTNVSNTFSESQNISKPSGIASLGINSDDNEASVVFRAGTPENLWAIGADDFTNQFVISSTNGLSSAQELLINTASNTVSVVNKRIISVTDPVSAQDAATKNYVDTSIPVVDFKDGGEAAGAARTLGNTTPQTLGLKTNNIERIHIQADGDIGFGTTSPLGRFHAEGSSTTQEVMVVRGVAGQVNPLFQVRNNTNADYLEVKANGQLRLEAYGAGTNTGTPTFGLAVDAAGNLIERNVFPSKRSFASVSGLTVNTTTFTDVPGLSVNITLAKSGWVAGEFNYSVIRSTATNVDAQIRIVIAGNNGITFVDTVSTFFDVGTVKHYLTVGAAGTYNVKVQMISSPGVTIQAGALTGSGQED